jgi:hypothetical protein
MEEEEEEKRRIDVYVRHSGTGNQNDKKYAVGDSLYISNLFFLVMDRISTEKSTVLDK